MSLTPDQQNELTACFQTFDMDQDGSLSVQECAMAMRSLGYDLPDNQVGQCTLQQFLGLAAQHIVVTDRGPKLQQALLCFDSQGSGWVPVNQLEYALQQFGERFSPQEFAAFKADCQPQQEQINAAQAAARLTFK
eukprot:TRINITY_DN1351_c0_g1_i2.p1 TRINITY_DN1351_c0_g1~~TRINITY_DN1351_c0_g1_i2.p1  ORF type:complete len:135 (-),score=19.74 TRINITY_DN1351_c0_g1_i2:44-448(-)